MRRFIELLDENDVLTLFNVNNIVMVEPHPKRDGASCIHCINCEDSNFCYLVNESYTRIKQLLEIACS